MPGTGTAPDELLESAENLTVDEPPADSLHPGEDPEFVFPIEDVSAKRFDVPQSSHRMGLLTDRRVMLFVVSYPISFPYHSLDVSTSTGFLSQCDFELDDQSTPGNPAFAVEVGSEKRSPVARTLAEHGSSPTADEIVRELRRRIDAASTWETELTDTNDALREALTAASAAEALDATLDHLDAALDDAEAADDLARKLDGARVEATPEEVTARVTAVLNDALAAAKSAVDDGRYQAAVGDAADVRESLDGRQAPSPEYEAQLDAVERAAVEGRLLECVETERYDAAIAVVSDRLGDRSASGVAHSPEALSDVLTEVRESAGDRRFSTFVARLVAEIDDFNGGRLARLLLAMLETDASLFDRVDRTGAAGLVRDSNPNNRLLGCRLLARLGTADDLDVLRSREDDTEYEVRVAAMRAMDAIAEREDVPLTDTDREQLRSVNVEYHGDVVEGDYRDASTVVEDSVVNRSALGGDTGDSEPASPDGDDGPNFCPDCGADFETYANPSFCPTCGFEL